MKKILTTMVSVAFASVFACFARAESISVEGGEITYSGAEAKVLPGGDVVLVYTNVSSGGSFAIPAGKSAKARILAVGGGGAGGSMPREDVLGRGAAGGGGGGGVSDREVVLSNGVYVVEVGEGGQRVQTVVQGWTGDNGGNTNLKIGDVTFASARGGGGGGTVKVNGRGEFGGSGGGGSWFGHGEAGVFYHGGGYVDGQGWNGGTPTDANIGGGGGGAAKAAADGMGGTGGAPGAGRVLDITGEAVEYGRGGRGGNRSAADYEPADGAGFGCGGDGAVRGYAGAGADGCFVVRIHKLFEYKVVQTPEYVKSFEFVPGQTVTAFDLASADQSLRDSVAYVEGVTSTSCSISGAGTANVVTNGLGRFFFVLHLDDESHWANGSSAPLICYWRVRDPGVIGDSEIDVTKTVEWFDGTNATIAIDVCATPEKVAVTPKVLILGSLCGKHGLTEDTVRTTINTIANIADVDAYYFNKVNSKSKPYGDNLMTVSLKKGESYNGAVTAGGTKLSDVSQNHGTLYGYYNKLWDIIQSGQTDEYDYIVFSFDRSKIATQFAGVHDHEAEVVEFLKGYYNRDAIVWLVDEEPKDWAVNGQVIVQQTPWVPNQLASMRGNQDEHFFGTLQYYKDRIDGSHNYNVFEAYNAMIGMFSPEKYPVRQSDYIVAECENTTWTSSTDHHVILNTAENVRRVNLSAGYAIENQCAYDNAANVADLLKHVVVERARPSTVRLRDNIHFESGLKVTGAAAYWTTNESAVAGWSLDPAVVSGWTAAAAACPGSVWTEMGGESFRVEEDENGRQTGVSIDLANIWNTAWIKLRMDVADEGGFRSSIGATFNEQTGLWEKDPNNGPVVASMTPDGSETVLAEASASTAVAWSFPSFKLTGQIVHGKGQIVLNGFVTDTIDVAEGCTPEVVFRGAGGYVVDYLEVDGQVIDDFDKDIYNWYFENVESDHVIRVGFKSVFTVPYPTTSAVEVEYDGQPHGPGNTEPTFIEGYSYEWYPVYSLDPDGEFTRDGGLVDVQYDAQGNVIAKDVYVRICIMQPGWEDGVMIDQWTGVNTVKVLPRPVTVKFDDVVQTSNTRVTTFTSYVSEGSIVEGETLNVTGKKNPSANYPSNTAGAKTAGFVIKDTCSVAKADGSDGTSNYAFTFVPGDYYYYGIVASAHNVSKVYDGTPVSMTVDVVFPTDASNRTIAYRSNGNTTFNESAPREYTDAGVYTNYFKVSGKGRVKVGNRNVSIGNLDPYEGYAVITILPRPVTVQAGSAEKAYDGTALTQPAYTVETGDGTGFVGAQGIASLSMTAESVQTLPGSTANVIDRGSVTLKNGTNASNYDITYVDGHLTVAANPISVVAHGASKTYDGQPVDPDDISLAVSFTNGTPFTAGYTVRYAEDEFSELSSALPSMPTDAGDYYVYYEVDAGGYGKQSGYMNIRVNPRDVRLVAASAAKEFDGTPLATNGFAVVSGGGSGEGFVDDDGIVSVVMTPSSVVEGIGTAANVIDTSDIAATWTFSGGLKPQNYNFIVEPGALTVTAPIAPVLPGDPAKVREPGYTGNMNDPESEDYPGYSVANDPVSPWTVVADPLNPPAEDPAHPGALITNYVAVTGGAGGEPTRIVLSATGPGELAWNDLLLDASEGGARITVSVDGGDPIVVGASGMSAWAARSVVFGGDTDTAHTVAISFEPGASGDALGYVDGVVWTPFAPAAKGDVVAPGGEGLAFANLGTEPSAERGGVTILRANGSETRLATVSETDENGRQLSSTVVPAAAEDTTGTEDYWYAVTGEGAPAARTASTLSPGESAAMAISGITGPAKISWRMLIEDDADGDSSALDVILTRTFAGPGGETLVEVVTNTYSAAQAAAWKEFSLTVAGPVEYVGNGVYEGSACEVAFVFRNNADGDGACTIANVAVARAPINVAPELNDGSNHAEEGFEYVGEVNDPADPHHPGYTVANDRLSPWEVVDGGTGRCATTPDYLGKGEETALTFEVVGDGELSWKSLVSTEGALPAVVIVVVDGATSQVYGVEADWTAHVVHVTEAEGEDNATHRIEIIFRNDGTSGGSSASVDSVVWTASASADDLYGTVVDTLPPTQPAEAIKNVISVSNDTSSGWMPVYGTVDGESAIVALRSPDGTEGPDASLHSEISFGVNGSGEIRLGALTVPVKGDSAANPDGGALTIMVDGIVYEIPPAQSENVSYSIVTNGDVVIISNLVIKVWMNDSTGPVPHKITLVYDREAGDIGGNTRAVVEDITWKTYGETDDGGTSWLDLNADEGRALMIVDHEPLTNGWVYLAFNPQLKYAVEEIGPWARRTSANGKLKVKFGATREACDDCEPISAALSDENDPTIPHTIETNKVWVMVRLTDIVAVCEETPDVEPVGFWRIYIAGNGETPKAESGDRASGGFASGAEGAASVNVFGIYKVESATTNTMIAVPWTWYSAVESNATAIPVSKLVKTTNLTDGDVIYAYDGEGRYAAWMLFGNEWMPGATVPVDENGNVGAPIHWDGDGGRTLIERGYGLWLHRQRPVDAEGRPVPFWLYGQSVTNDVASTVAGGTPLNPSYAIFGNPYCREVRINDIAWPVGKIDPEDRLVVPNGRNGIDYLQFDPADGKGWYRVDVVASGKRLKNTYNYDVKIPAGQAFWYRRHGAEPITISWPK